MGEGETGVLLPPVGQIAKASAANPSLHINAKHMNIKKKCIAASNKNIIVLDLGGNQLDSSSKTTQD